MAFRVMDALHCHGLQSFHVVAGMSGLNRRIGSVEIMDAEFDVDGLNLAARDHLFSKNALILTSLLFIKNEPDKILPVVKRLAQEQVSALAIEEIYFSKLPQEVIDFADEQELPILMFDYDDANMEEILIEIHDAMVNADSDAYTRKKIEELLSDGISPATVFTIASEIMEGYKPPYFVYYVKLRFEKDRMHYYRMAHTIDNEDEKRTYKYFSYKRGFFIVFCQKDDKISRQRRLEDILNTSQWEKADLYTGCSKTYSLWKYLNLAMKEAYYAAEYAEVFRKDYTEFVNMGIYQVLIPYRNDIWITAYCESLLSRLREYDAEFKTELYETVLEYIMNNYDIPLVAERMHMHKNTVRYRIGKAREIMGMDEENSNFEEQLSFAFQWQMLKKEE